jgi:ferredoxin
MTSPVAILTVRTEGAVLRVAVPSGQSVREALDASSLRVRAACAGTGSCGACAVRLVSGAVNPPTVADCVAFRPGSGRADSASPAK